MGWTFYYKPKGEKAIESIKRNALGLEWCEKHFVMASATIGAVHIVAKFHEPDSKVYVPDADGMVRAILVFKIRSVPKDHYNFGYKDMDESCGPYGCECAPSIIAAASPLRDPIGPEPEYSGLRSARAYRERSLAVAKAKAAKRALKVGAKVKLPKPLSFGGIMLDEFIVDRCRVRGRKGMSTVFRSLKTGGLYGLRASDLTGASIEGTSQ
jgi:hypothetical protein